MSKMGPETEFGIRLRSSLGVQYGRRQFVWKHHSSEYDPPGIPDLCGHLDGQFLAWELKVNGSYPTQAQLQNLIRFGEEGCLAALVVTVEREAYYVPWSVVKVWNDEYNKGSKVLKFSYTESARALWTKLPVRKTPDGSLYYHLKTALESQGVEPTRSPS